MFVAFIAEIPAVTVKTDEEYAQIVENLRWRPTFYKIAQFFIVDLLRAEKVEDASYFRFKNVDFKTVLIKGTVVGVGDMATRLLITGGSYNKKIAKMWLLFVFV